jgi:hypothetical protein
MFILLCLILYRSVLYNCVFALNIKRPCVKCKYFQRDTIYSELGRCKIFRGELTKICRYRPKMCGYNGSFWEEYISY